MLYHKLSLWALFRSAVSYLKTYRYGREKEARQNGTGKKLATADWVMAEFYATWCPHCKRMQPVVEEFKKLMEGTLEVVQIDIDQEDAFG